MVVGWQAKAGGEMNDRKKLPAQLVELVRRFEATSEVHLDPAVMAAADRSNFDNLSKDIIRELKRLGRPTTDIQAMWDAVEAAGGDIDNPTKEDVQIRLPAARHEVLTRSDIITTTAACKIIGCHRSSLIRWAEDAGIESTGRGKWRRIRHRNS